MPLEWNRTCSAAGDANFLDPQWRPTKKKPPMGEAVDAKKHESCKRPASSVLDEVERLPSPADVSCLTWGVMIASAPSILRDCLG